jgi:hypothetical protein
MKTCANRDEWLGALLYRDLPFDEESQAEEHLEACATCRSERDGLANLVVALPKPQAVPPVRSSLGWVPIAAACLLGALVGFTAARLPSPPPANDVPRASVRLVSPEAAAFVRGGAPALAPRHQAALAERLK